MLNILNVATSGLAASQVQVENVMNNIANENTPGYKKRVVELTESQHSDSRITGRGVTIGETTRVVNTYIYDNLTTQKSKNSQYTELSTMLSDIESIFHETEDSGFSADLNRYFQSVENLRSSPNNEIYKNDLRSNGSAIVDDLKTLYGDIENSETASLNKVSDDLTALNASLQDIGGVNKILTDSPVVSNDLLDKRDGLEQDISKYIDLDIDRRNDYELKITGLTAVRFDNNVHKLTLANNTIAQKDVYANDTNPLSSSLVDVATWKNAGDKVTYKLNNTTSVSVEYGTYLQDANGANVDLDGDGTADTVDKNNIVKALVYKINNTTGLASNITAYNGDYALDKDGNKILTSDPSHPDYDASNIYKDRYLVIESGVAGDVGKFDGRIIVEDADNSSAAVNLEKNSIESVKGTDDVHLEIFDQKLNIKDGSLRPLLDNLNSTSYDNLFIKYKEQLDNIAKAISDMSGSYIENTDGSYVSGTKAVDVDSNRSKRVDIGLFSGSTVSTLKFNDGIVGGLTQSKLDYLSTLQSSNSIDFDGSGSNLTSFSKYNQSLRIAISNDKETTDFKKTTQESVTNALQTSYDKLTKVNKDEELINLVKFQAAYRANAKLITIVDEMLNTLLGIKR